MTTEELVIVAVEWTNRWTGERERARLGSDRRSVMLEVRDELGWRPCGDVGERAWDRPATHALRHWAESRASPEDLPRALTRLRRLPALYR